MEDSITMDSSSENSAESDGRNGSPSNHRDPNAQMGSTRACTMSVPVASTPSRMDAEALVQPPRTSLTVKSEKKPQPTDAKEEKLFKEEGIFVILDKTLDYMSQVDEHMRNFQAYIRSQREQNKPLYQWDKYDGYCTLIRTVSTLDEAMLRIKHIPKKHARLHCVDFTMYISRAARLSTSVSNAAVHALSAISQRSVTCMDEVEQSSLSNGAKYDAKMLIFNEVRELIRYTTRATDCMHATMDLIQKTIHVDCPNEQQGACRENKPIPRLETTQRVLGGRSWTRTLARVLLSAAIGLAAVHLYGPSGFDFMVKWNRDGNVLYGQMIDIIERTQALANMTSELHWIKLRDMEQRYEELETISEAHGLRIDNLVESLGPPNSEGTYFVSSQSDREIANVKSDVLNISNDVDRQIKQLQKDMEQIHKSMLRMDIRLASRLDKVSCGK